MVPRYRFTAFLQIPGHPSLKLAQQEAMWPKGLEDRVVMPGVTGIVVDVCECVISGERALSIDVVEENPGDETTQQKVLRLQNLGWTITKDHKSQKDHKNSEQSYGEFGE